MLYTIIIDRVGNTNIFNLIYDDTINDPNLHSNEGLYSIIDTDLIEEYLDELDHVANASRSVLRLAENQGDNRGLRLHQLNLNQKLKQIGQTIFRQFFPEELQKFIRNKSNIAFFFHLAPELASIPLEIMHDGDGFMWEKFYIGKSIKGKQASLYDSTPKENINMLIIADPTEDLDWARREGEFLFEQLSTHFSEKSLNVQLVGGREVTKLSLLNMLLHMDIIHYCGHLHYSDSPEENGWILYNSKIVYAREIQKSGTEPLLIFSNSCFSGRGSKENRDPKKWYSQFASSFLRSGKTSYIGTNWELPDSESTIEFTLNFYDLLLKGAPVGAALQKSRKFIKKKNQFNDLTWASYLLIGNPLNKIFSEAQSIPDLTKNMIEDSKILKEYPYPIAKAYEAFLKASRKVGISDDIERNKQALQALFHLTEQIVYFILSVVLSNLECYRMRHKDDKAFQSLGESLSLLYRLLESTRKNKIQLLIPNLLETLLRFKRSLNKVHDFQKDVFARNKKISKAKLQREFVAGQFFIENFLTEIEFFKHYGFYYIRNPGLKQLSLKGLEKEHILDNIILPTQLDDKTKKEIIEITSYMSQKCVFYIPFKKICLDLSKYTSISFQTGKNLNKIKELKFVHMSPVPKENESKKKMG